MKKKANPDYGALLAAATSSRDDGMRGQLVRSRAGHDKGCYYLVLARSDDMLYLADGRKRGAANPKKKNIRHVQVVHRVAADLMTNPDAALPSDVEIRAALAQLTKEGE